MENARLSWEVHVIRNKTKQDVLRENKVYYCIEKKCLLRKFKPKLLGKLHRIKAI